jgi:hypothetical protein
MFKLRALFYMESPELLRNPLSVKDRQKASRVFFELESAGNASRSAASRLRVDRVKATQCPREAVARGDSVRNAPNMRPTPISMPSTSIAPATYKKQQNWRQERSNAPD